MDILDYKALGERIRRQRQHLKLTQEQLAELIGVSHSYVGHIERGSRVASLETLVALCNVLQVSPQTLLQASLNALDVHLPSELGPEDRSRLRHLFRLAQDTLDNWND